jgi:hypothetical protein
VALPSLDCRTICIFVIIFISAVTWHPQWNNFTLLGAQWNWQKFQWCNHVYRCVKSVSSIHIAQLAASLRANFIHMHPTLTQDSGTALLSVLNGIKSIMCIPLEIHVNRMNLSGTDSLGCVHVAGSCMMARRFTITMVPRAPWNPQPGC